MKAIFRRHIRHAEDCPLASAQQTSNMRFRLTRCDKCQRKEEYSHLVRGKLCHRSFRHLITYEGQQLDVVSLLNGDSRLHNRSSTLEHGCTAEELLKRQLYLLHRIGLSTAREVQGLISGVVQSPTSL